MICITQADINLAESIAETTPTSKVSFWGDGDKWVTIKHDVRTADFSYDTNETVTKADDYLTLNARKREAWARADDALGTAIPGNSIAHAVNYVGKHRKRRANLKMIMD
jgi:hypothetical protein